MGLKVGFEYLLETGLVHLGMTMHMHHDLSHVMHRNTRLSMIGWKFVNFQKKHCRDFKAFYQ